MKIKYWFMLALITVNLMMFAGIVESQQFESPWIFDWNHYSKGSEKVEEAERLFEEGKQQYDAQNFKEAVRLLEKAITLYPEPEYYFTLGDIYYDMSDWENGAKAYRVSGILHYKRSDYAFYNAACCLSILIPETNVDLDEIKRLLHHAFQAGYSHFNYIRKDGDMTNALRDPDVRALVDQYEKLDDDEKVLIGLWHDSPMMGDSWSNTYSFFPDGSVILRTRDFEKRGRWTIDEGKGGYIHILYLHFEDGTSAGKLILPESYPFELYGAIQIGEEYSLGEGSWYRFSQVPSDYPSGPPWVAMPQIMGK